MKGINKAAKKWPSSNEKKQAKKLRTALIANTWKLASFPPHHVFSLSGHNISHSVILPTLLEIV